MRCNITLHIMVFCHAISFRSSLGTNGAMAFIAIALIALIIVFFLLKKYKVLPKVNVLFKISIGDKDNIPNSTKELTDGKLDEIAKGLADLELQEFYLQPNISIRTLSDRLDTNVKYVSTYLNQHLGHSYATYINGLRIQWLMDKIINDPGFTKKYTLDAMAQQCGFTSNKALNEACKRLIGKTSSQLIRNLNNDG